MLRFERRLAWTGNEFYIHSQSSGIRCGPWDTPPADDAGTGRDSGAGLFLKILTTRLFGCPSPNFG